MGGLYFVHGSVCLCETIVKSFIRRKSKGEGEGEGLRRDRDEGWIYYRVENFSTDRSQVPTGNPKLTEKSRWGRGR